ncbi:MAG: hypothetical protein KAH99_05075 [Verrucomicrobia bacterium]|nr:hypothetical protein [Verrucomicrobiota bacterium]
MESKTVVGGGDPGFARLNSIPRMVSDYIHLNPADAGIAELGALQEYLWSSYPLYLKPLSKRPD